MQQKGLLFLLLGLSCLAQAQTPLEVVQKIITEGRDHSHALSTLKELALGIGPRLTASPRLESAFAWTQDKFKSYGCTNVHFEEWGNLPLGFDRGPRQSVSLVAPYELPMDFTTPCYTVGTKGPVEGEVVSIPPDLKSAKETPDRYKGKWILMGDKTGMRPPNLAKPSELDLYLDSKQIVGRIWGTSGPYVWTHGRWDGYTDANRPKTPLIIVNHESFGVIKYNVEQGRHPRLRANIENIFYPRPFHVGNVIAEIKGTEKPEEVVIIGGHLDSWNGPGSQGASDNGTGTCATLEAARLLNLVGAKPKRTIRFVLFSGEEQGLYGSRDYVVKHKAELPNIQAVLIEDEGQNWQNGIPSLASQFDILTAAAAPLAQAFPKMPYVVKVVSKLPAGGSDHGPFIQAGVPAFAIDKDRTLSYTRVWHTQFDRWEEVPPENLAQMNTCMAVMAFSLATCPVRLARPLAVSARKVPGKTGG